MGEQIEVNQTNGRSRRNFLKTLLLAGAYPAAKPLEIIAEELSESTNTSEAGWAQSASAIDSPLESRIDAYVKARRRSGYLSNTDQFSITVYDIEHDRKLVSINEDTRRMAASTIKNFVMLAVFDQIDEGRISYNQRLRDRVMRRDLTVKDLLESIISYKYDPPGGSRIGNRHTNMLIDLFGGSARLNAIIQKYGLFSETRIVEKIPPDGRTYRNTTSTHDLNIFYNQMWHNELPQSVEMRRILGLHKKNGSRVFNGTCIPDDVLQYTKSGYVYGVNADSGILVMRDARGNPHPYAISVMIEDKTKPYSRRRIPGWGRRRSELIRDISEGVYDFLYQTHMGRPYVCNQHKGMHLGGRQ
ncbi:serine hydrolase [Candidatus Woesearchaeota archaeon]|nr:serine hydrolase [Candidatus Woesearchaeota archaeon]